MATYWFRRLWNDATNTFFGVKVTDGAVQALPFDYYTEVARGNVPGRSILRGLGERESIGTTSTGEDLWRGNELTPAPTSHLVIPTPADAGEQMSVVSEDANDTSAGTGVREVTIIYLDATGAEQTTTVTMNGTTPVDLTPSNVRFVQDMYASAVGSGGVAAGHIKIHKTSTVGLVYNMIALGGNMSVVPNKMVPLGKALYLKYWMPTEGANKRLIMRLRSDCTPMGIRQQGIFLFKSIAYINQSSLGAIPLAYKIPALSIVKASAWAIAINGEASVHWWGELVDD